MSIELARDRTRARRPARPCGIGVPPPPVGLADSNVGAPPPADEESFCNDDGCPRYDDYSDEPLGSRFAYSGIEAIQAIHPSFAPLFYEALEVILTYVDVVDLGVGADELGMWLEDEVAVMAGTVDSLRSILQDGQGPSGQRVAIYIASCDFYTAEDILIASAHDYGDAAGARQENRMRLASSHGTSQAYVARMDDASGAALYMIVIPTESAAADDWERMLEYYSSCDDECVDRHTSWDVRRRMAAVAKASEVLLHELLHIAFDQAYPDVQAMLTPSRMAARAQFGIGLSALEQFLGSRPFQNAGRVGELLAYKLSKFWLYNCFGAVGFACHSEDTPLEAVITNSDKLWKLRFFNFFNGNDSNSFIDLSAWLCLSKLEGENPDLKPESDDWMEDVPPSWTEPVWFP